MVKQAVTYRTSPFTSGRFTLIARTRILVRARVLVIRPSSISVGVGKRFTCLPSEEERERHDLLRNLQCCNGSLLERHALYSDVSNLLGGRDDTEEAAIG